MKFIRLLTQRQVMATLRNPVFIFMGVITPLLYLALYSPLLKHMYGTSEGVLNSFVPGMLVLVAFSSGLFAGFGIVDELRSGIIERFRVTPASRFSLLAGPVCNDLIFMVIQTGLFVLFALPFGFRMNPIGLLILYPLLALLLMTVSSFSNAIGLITKGEDKVAPIVQGLNLPVLLLSGVLLPMSLAPPWLNMLAHGNPVYYVVEAARALAAGDLGSGVVLEAYAVMIPLTIIVMIWATRVFRKAVM
jgi:ABC-2 type transport system permease protein